MIQRLTRHRLGFQLPLLPSKLAVPPSLRLINPHSKLHQRVKPFALTPLTLLPIRTQRSINDVRVDIQKLREGEAEGGEGVGSVGLEEDVGALEEGGESGAVGGAAVP